MARAITVVRVGPNDYSVHVGEDYAARLTIDEALGSFARWLFMNNAMFVESPDSNVDRFVRHRKCMSLRQAASKDEDQC